MKRLLVGAILLAGALPAAAQEQAPAQVRLTSLKLEPEALPADRKAVLVASFAMDPGWHIYSADPASKGRTEFFLDKDGPAAIAGPIGEPKPHDDDGFLQHEGEATFRVPLQFGSQLPPGPVKLTGTIRGSVCDPNQCNPFKFPFSLTATVPQGAPPPVAAATPAPSPAPEEDEATKEANRILREKGLLGFLLLAIGGGLFSLVQPCVYPLIPITLTFFAKQAGQSRAQGVTLSSLYAIGIIVSFTALGFLLTVILGPRGAQIFGSNGWVNLVVASLFLLFAVSLFGAFELQLPASWTARLVGGQRKGAGGALILGLLFSVVTFTCTVPIAATVFTIAAGGAHRLTGLLAMFTYSATMALPFFLLGFFPSLIKEVPKSGGWLQTVKVTGGFLEVALATQYLGNADIVFNWGIFSRHVILVVWTAVGLLTTLYLLGFFRLKHDSPEPVQLGFVRLLCAIAFGFLSVYCMGGVFGRPVPLIAFALPPDFQDQAGVRVDFHALAPAEAESRRTGKPLFIEFTGAQ